MRGAPEPAGLDAAAVLGLLLAAALGPAAAQEKGIYLGGSIGHSEYQDVCQTSLVPCDENDTAWRLFAGYQFHRNWAAELGYGLFGRARGEGPITGGVGSGSFEQEAKGWDVSLLGSFQIGGGFWGFGRLGAYSARTTLDQQGTSFADLHDADSQSGFTYGAGVAYNLGRLGVRLEWQRYDNIGMNTFGHDDLDVFSLGVLFRF